MGKNLITITNNTTGQSENFPLLKGTHGPAVFDVRQLYQKWGFLPTTLASNLQQVVKAKLHTLTVKKGSFSIVVTLSSNWPNKAIFWKSAASSFMENYPPRNNTIIS